MTNRTELIESNIEVIETARQMMKEGVDIILARKWMIDKAEYKKLDDLQIIWKHAVARAWGYKSFMEFATYHIDNIVSALNRLSNFDINRPSILTANLVQDHTNFADVANYVNLIIEQRYPETKRFFHIEQTGFNVYQLTHEK